MQFEINPIPTKRAVYILIDGGTVDDVAQQLFEELSSGGYSLLFEDVQHAAKVEAQYYAAWAVPEVQRAAVQRGLLDGSAGLQGYEWAIIDPVLRAHCDLLQARLVEGSRSLGGDGFGLAVSEANTIYNEARKTMQNEAFVEPPISFGLTGLL